MSQVALRVVVISCFSVLARWIPLHHGQNDWILVTPWAESCWPFTIPMVLWPQKKSGFHVNPPHIPSHDSQTFTISSRLYFSRSNRVASGRPMRTTFSPAFTQPAVKLSTWLWAWNDPKKTGWALWNAYLSAIYPIDSQLACFQLCQFLTKEASASTQWDPIIIMIHNQVTYSDIVIQKESWYGVICMVQMMNFHPSSTT